MSSAEWWVNDDNAALLTDLYELTMAASYFRRGMTEPATFDLFVRNLPRQRHFLVACGLEQVLHYLEELRFTEESLEYLSSLEMFDDHFLAHLRDFSFTGEVWGVPEGELAFANEPLLRVTAPLIEAQVVETFLINCICFQTMIASKAARVALACKDRRFVDFSPRRDHGADAALKAARASFVGGAAATSNVLAGRLFGIPVTGTMAHSYVMAFDSETEAFRAFAQDFPDDAVLLIDTFDIEEGARRAVRVAEELAPRGVRLRGVRIDSGNLARMTRSVRKILDDAGLVETQIFLSGDMDEHRIASLLSEDVPADAFGVGTQMGTSADAASLGGVYKLVADREGPRIKLSQGKATLPGRKQVYRFSDDGFYVHDLIALEEEHPPPEARPVLEKVMEQGRRTGPPKDLVALQQRCRRSIDALPQRLRRLGHAEEPYPVQRSKELDRLIDEMTAQQH